MHSNNVDEACVVPGILLIYQFKQVLRNNYFEIYGFCLRLKHRQACFPSLPSSTLTTTENLKLVFSCVKHCFTIMWRSKCMHSSAFSFCGGAMTPFYVFQSNHFCRGVWQEHHDNEDKVLCSLALFLLNTTALSWCDADGNALLTAAYFGVRHISDYQLVARGQAGHIGKLVQVLHSCASFCLGGNCSLWSPQQLESISYCPYIIIYHGGLSETNERLGNL